MKGNKTNHRLCKVCKHESRWRIELLRAGGASLDSLAAKFGVDRDAIWRHWTKHVSDEMKAGYLAGPVQLQELAAKAADTGSSVLDHLHAIRTVLMGHLTTMTEAGDGIGASHVAGKLTRVLETIAKIGGELGEMARSVVITNNNIAIMSHPGFAQVQATLLRALAPHPAARAAVVVALRGLDSGNAPASPATSSAMKVIEHVA
jgi:hypothetical protein